MRTSSRKSPTASPSSEPTTACLMFDPILLMAVADVAQHVRPVRPVHHDPGEEDGVALGVPAHFDQALALHPVLEGVRAVLRGARKRRARG